MINPRRIRMRLTLAYAGSFALMTLILGALAAFGLHAILMDQFDERLAAKAEAHAENLRDGETPENLASTEFGWISLEPDGTVISEAPIGEDSIAASFGLPSSELARETLREKDVVFGTIEGREGEVRVASAPMRESGEAVGVIQYAGSLQSVREAMEGFVLVLVMLGIGGMILAVVFGVYMSGRAVRPAREAYQGQRVFVAEASHELKTPLTLIRANAEVLRRGLDDPEDRELIDDLLAEADRMNSMFSSLLLAARFDAGKLPVREEDFDLSAVISDAADRFKTRANSAHVRLDIQIPDELPAHADPERTGQILAVVLDNAFDHTPPSGAVTVVARPKGGSVEVAVRDTGPGISAEDLPRLFERYYLADATKRGRGGTGLGLPIARALARAQNGDLEAANAKEGGAIFTLTLPAG
jgi:signal transduction histidine kinase